MPFSSEPPVAKEFNERTEDGINGLIALLHQEGLGMWTKPHHSRLLALSSRRSSWGHIS